MNQAVCFPALADAYNLKLAEAFLVQEAQMLDDWHLEEWFSLFEPGARYVIDPINNARTTDVQSLPIVNDDYNRLRERVNHLVNRQAWAERPRSRTRRLITNVRVSKSDDLLQVRANFVVYQFRNSESWEFVGTSLYHLKPRNNGYAIAHRQMQLDHETMGTQRRISIIV